MSGVSDDQEGGGGTSAQPGRRPRSDAQRNLLTLLQAAKEVFADAGIDAPVRDIAERAGVGVGTVYRHFPRRADLIAAVFWQEIDACADRVEQIAAERPPFEAVALGMLEFVRLASTKRGLAQALHSGDPAFASLADRREQRLWPAFRRLFDDAVSAGAIHGRINADELLNAAATLCLSADDARPGQAQRLVSLLVDGLRCPSEFG